MNFKYIYKVILFTFTLSLNTIYAQTNCQQIYVTVNGNGNGSISSPTSLLNALDISNNGDIIKLSAGIYNINNAINLKSGITLEGGFDATNKWEKSSLREETVIYRTSQNLEGNTHAKRIVAIYGNNISNFNLQDLTIKTSNINSYGGSTYGIHLSACSDYSLTRCYVKPGNASNGTNGSAGSAGANGMSGQYGVAGSADSSSGGISGSGGKGGGAGGNGGNNGGFNGADGTLEGNMMSGGGGGQGGRGGYSDSNGGRGGRGASHLTYSTGGNGGNDGSCTSTPATCGGIGQNGYNGNSGYNGGHGPSGSHQNGFWIPGSIANSGTNGYGGGGGAGGGGGGGQYGVFCIDGRGSGGGGGGGGGQGGTGGNGGRGGGSSFGIYLHNNGSNTHIIQSEVLSGNAGNGGYGGPGGQGGQGGNKGLGNSYSVDVGCGGHGGHGGDGGNGGFGGDGSVGVSYNVYLGSNSEALITSDSIFNLSATNEINFSDSYCPNTPVEFNSNTNGNWEFGPNATPSSYNGNSVSVTYSESGRYDVSFNNNNYKSIVGIQGNVIDDINAGADQILCDSNNAFLEGNTPTEGEGSWTSLGNGVVLNPIDPNSEVSGLSPGDNIFEWTITGCCGSTSDTVNIFVAEATSSVETIVGCNSYTWRDGITYTEDNNTATFNSTNSMGCDELVTLDLTIEKIFKDIVQYDNTLIVNESANATYQWIDCANDYTEIPGETNSFMKLNNTGSYAVVVTTDNCTDISECFKVENLNTTSSSDYEIEIFPNPSSSGIYINTNKNFVFASVKVYDILGKLVDEIKINNNELIYYDFNQPKGVYVLSMLIDGKTYLKKIVKQ
jgi:hypothetical protein